MESIGVAAHAVRVDDVRVELREMTRHGRFRRRKEVTEFTRKETCVLLDFRPGVHCVDVTEERGPVLNNLSACWYRTRELRAVVLIRMDLRQVCVPACYR